jgi:hypothetical protein
MTATYFPALSTFDVSAAERLGIGCDVGCAHVGAEPTQDTMELKFSPSGVSLRGRFWREGHFLKAAVHIQAAAGAPRTVTAQVDLRPIARALRKWYARNHGVRISGWPGSFIKRIGKIAKSKLIADVGHAIKSVVQSKVTGAALGVAAVVFPPVGLPAAAAYATANSALAAIERARALKNAAQSVLANGTAAQKAVLASGAAELKAALEQAANVRAKLREVALRAKQGDLAARKTARIFRYVVEHRKRVQDYEPALHGKQAMPGLLVAPAGRVMQNKWLRLAAAEAQAQSQGARLLSAAPRLPPMNQAWRPPW